MQNLIGKTYNFKEIEEKLLERFYSMDLEPKFTEPSYSIVIPPPNVTGSLHMGHALNSTIQDFLIRYNLLEGKDVVWFVGTDHAGIATQTVVEKELLKQGISRFDLSTEKFLEKIWQWKDKYGKTILEQFKKLGLYANIDKARFTMDELYSLAVKRAFVELYKKGYIYKGKRVVNWCPRCLTGLSDLEVVHKTAQTKLYYVKYKLEDCDEYIVVATTRPETIFADTAIAVNPKDSRYTKYINKKVIVPVINRAVPVIVWDGVDMEFGTGVLKVTPAHDFNDFKIYQKNKQIGIINIFDRQARLVFSEKDILDNPHLQDYQGLDRFKAREKMVNELQSKGLLEKIEDYTTNIGHCYRCDTIIEPFYSDQWFISMKELVKKPRELVEKEQIRFFPKTYKKVILQWYDDIEDWCISRQIVWGHRIPVYCCSDCGHCEASEENLTKCINCGSSNIKQEEDVLDTWFSSALWPFAVMYWPSKEFQKYLKYYYPTDVLTTAREIVFLWVSRMIVMSSFFLDEIPFKDVIIHSVILAPSGKRMSKSLGTGIDPLELIDKYGADAVRMGLIIQTAESQDVKFNFEKIEMARNFINKLWNAIRYFQIKKSQKNLNQADKKTIQIINNWLIHNTKVLIDNLEDYAKNYKFFDYCMELYHFVWNVFCDWYIEFTKFYDYEDFKETLEKVLKSILLYLHPLIPFSTFYLYENIFGSNLLQERFGNMKFEFKLYREDFEVIQNLIDSIKEVRPFVNEILSLGSKQVEIEITDDLDEQIKKLFYHFTKSTISKELKLSQKYFNLSTKIGNIRIFLEQDLIERYKKLINKKIEDYSKNIEKIERLLNNKEFMEKADSQVVENYKQNLFKYKEMININRSILVEI